MGEKTVSRSELSNGTVKPIALYLPQFHRIPENDKWWGDGFTEWTNTRKAEPFFDGHYQPRTPLDNYYYDLSDVAVMERQAELAQSYGVFGFCYYHYWFADGKKLLEKPLEQMMDDKNVDIPFCICWANENWTRNWDGGNRELLIKQEYGEKKLWEKHFQYLFDFFWDERYITYEGKPILLIYKPELIHKFDEMMEYWEGRIREEGFPGLIIIRQSPQYYIWSGWNSRMLDYTLKYEPGFSYWFQRYQRKKSNGVKRSIKRQLINLGIYDTLKQMINSSVKKNEGSQLEILDYDKTWRFIIDKNPYDMNLINGAFVDWDNTPRLKNGRVYKGASPEKFEKYMIELLKKPTAMNCIFINAWNEWAEGAYLEPDERYGYGYLEALKRAIGRTD